MSRTIRRKNVKHASRYWDNLVFEELVLVDDFRFEWVKIDKDKDPKKWKKAWWKSHAESSHANERTPGKWYRKSREKQLRNISRAELHKAKTIPDYEEMVPQNPISHWWDWS